MQLERKRRERKKGNENRREEEQIPAGERMDQEDAEGQGVNMQNSRKR